MGDIWFPRKFQPLFRPSRYKVGKGGRGGAKSWNFARALIIQSTQQPLRNLCTREYQNSIQESVHRLLSEQIDALGYSHLFDVQQKAIYGTNGSEFIFAGLKTNPTKIKSLEGVDRVWVEEAEKVSNRSWDILIPTIRKPDSEIWITYNPDEEDDPTDKRFIQNTPPNTIIIDVSFRDNPWFPKVLKEEMEYAFKVDPEGADHIWNGNYRKKSLAQIFRGKYSIESFESDRSPFSTWKGPYFGLDFGFSDDPLFGVEMWINNRTLYIEYESYGHHVENDDIAPKLRRELPDIGDSVTRCDNARPETISHIKKKGNINAVGAEKWQGSVEDGITFLLSFEKIVIHTRCVHMQDEAKHYKYKVDPLTGDVLRAIVDAHNHGWDAVRYGLQPMIKHKRSMYDVL